MKRVISIFITIAVIILTVSTTTACGGGLSGKYFSVVDGINTNSEHEYWFKNGKVYDYGTEEGNYKIKGNKLIMTCTFMGMTEEYEFTLSKDKNSFTDGTTTYVKEGT